MSKTKKKSPLKGQKRLTGTAPGTFFQASVVEAEVLGERRTALAQSSGGTSGRRGEAVRGLISEYGGEGDPMPACRQVASGSQLVTQAEPGEGSALQLAPHQRDFLEVSPMRAAQRVETRGPREERQDSRKQDSDVEFVRTGYGKDAVKVLQIKRDGKWHYIKEIEASVQLSLQSKKDYLEGDNGDIIPTDTIKNTVYALAKIKGIKTIEEFSLELCNHFLSSFGHVTRVHVCIQEVPWKRFEKDGVQHVHAFVYSPEGVHFCEVEQIRGGQPVVSSGLKDLQVLKTTQSGFEGFIKDRFTTLQEVRDRCFSTVVYSKWRYNNHKGVNFEAKWQTMKAIILDKFAGPYDKGEYSPSVQKTLYDIQILGLSTNPEIEEIEVKLPNKHYFTIDLSKFGLTNQDEILLPSDKPYGNITGSVRRRVPSKL